MEGEGGRLGAEEGAGRQAGAREEGEKVPGDHGHIKPVELDHSTSASAGLTGMLETDCPRPYPGHR